MKHLFIFLLLWVLTTGPARAQYGRTVSVDSLRHVLTRPQQDTSRVLVLVELCAQLRYTTPDAAMHYAQQALMLAQRLTFYRGEGVALSEVGFVLRETGNLPKALEVTLKALRIAQQYRYPLEEAIFTQRIANIYTDLKEYDKSILYNRQSLKLAEAIHNKPYIAIQQQNLGAAYLYANQLDSAKRYLQVGYDNIVRLKLDRILSSILRNLGFLQEKLGHTEQVLPYYQQSVEASLQMDDYRNAAFTYYRIASFYLKLNQLDSAIANAQKSLVQAQAGPFYIHILNSSELLAAVYKQKQDYRQAFTYQELMLKAKEKLFGAGNIQAIQTVIANEEKRQLEVEQAKAAYQSQIRQYALLAGLGAFLLIALILYRNNQQKHRANQLLTEQKVKVEQTLETLRTTQTQLIQKEKMASLGELTAGIAHEIQNPLNFVNNFSDVSVELIEEQKQALVNGDYEEVGLIADDLSQNLQRITQNGQRASNIVRGMLEHSRTSTGERQPTDLNALADEYLRLAYQGVRAKDSAFNCELVTHFNPDLPLISVAASDISRVLLNLFNNAFYAVNQKQKTAPADYVPTVSVSTTFSNGQVEIQVRDNGMGIPDAIKEKIFQPFFTTKPTGEGTGLGLSLSYDIVTKGHGGEMRVATKENAYTEFKVTLPNNSTL